MTNRTADLAAVAESIEGSITNIRAMQDALAQKVAVSQMERDQALASYNAVAAERDQAIASIGDINASVDRLIAAAHDMLSIHQPGS